MIQSILDNVQSDKFERLRLETAMVKVSLAVQSLIGFERIPDGVRAEVGDYFIISESRCFSNGWIQLLEIVPKEFGPVSLGWANKANPHWVKPEGTRTVVLPPDSIITDVLTQLEAMQDKSC